MYVIYIHNLAVSSFKCILAETSMQVSVEWDISYLPIGGVRKHASDALSLVYLPGEGERIECEKFKLIALSSFSSHSSRRIPSPARIAKRNALASLWPHARKNIYSLQILSPWAVEWTVLLSLRDLPPNYKIDPKVCERLFVLASSELIPSRFRTKAESKVETGSPILRVSRFPYSAQEINILTGALRAEKYTGQS